MAKNSIRDFSATAGSNTDIQSVNIDENCPASGINNAIRELMVDLKNVSTGAVNLETPAADSLTVAGDLTVDTNTLKVDSSNNRVGIGVAAPDVHLHVQNDTNPRFRVEDTTNNVKFDVISQNSDVKIGTNSNHDLRVMTNNTEQVRITSGGSVGIGTSTVDSALHIEQNASGVTETSGSTLKIHNTNASGRSKISLHNSAETASGSIYYDTDSGMLALQGDTGAGVVIQTSGNNERVRVDTSGNVGIGTSSPARDLHVSGGTDTRIRTEESGGSMIDLTVTNSGHFIDSTSTGDLTVNKIGSANMIFKTTNAERMRIDSSGIVKIGTTGTALDGATNEGIVLQPAGKSVIAQDGTVVLELHRSDNTTSDETVALFRRRGSLVGSISCTTSATSFNTSSDHRLKENVADMTGAIDRVKALAPKRFNFIADAHTTVDGFLAHEAQTVVPEAVTGTHNEVDDDGNAVMQGIDQSKLVPLLTGALQESITKIEALETEMTALKARVTELEA